MQKSVAQSSTEAEYYALGDCCKQVLWIKSLLGELYYKLNAIPICGDNQGSIFMASNPVQERRSKHVDIRYHFIRDVVQSGAVELFYIEGNDNPADMFAKNLGHVKFLKFRAVLPTQGCSNTNFLPAPCVDSGPAPHRPVYPGRNLRYTPDVPHLPPLGTSRTSRTVLTDIEHILRKVREAVEDEEAGVDSEAQKSNSGPLPKEADEACQWVRDLVDELKLVWARKYKKPPEFFARRMGMSIKPQRETSTWGLFQRKFRNENPDLNKKLFSKLASAAYKKLNDSMDEWTQDAIDLYWDEVRSEFDASRVAESDDEEYWSDKNVRIRVKEFAAHLMDMANTFGRLHGTHAMGVVVHVLVDDGVQYIQWYGNTKETKALMDANENIMNQLNGFIRTLIAALKLSQMGWDMGPGLETILRWSKTRAVPTPKPLVLASLTAKTPHGKTATKTGKVNKVQKGGDAGLEDELNGGGLAPSDLTASAEEKQIMYTAQTLRCYSKGTSVMYVAL
ncbi:hypothetical protein EUX98_g9731 [Antrodiella citrinella]|uniref:Reverse transcriptase Ty1/copia-type domain-containing protein n=1 Tax=Antrodiella citrinella TaxID=2447956 RepID=A0A4S4LMI0_9APHY|nr:hypothetical protein EUX98_g9731 [Antrodiella citrinella]